MKRFFAMPRSVKGIISMLLDVTVCLLTVAMAYYLRLNELRLPIGNEWISFLVPMVAAPFLFFVFGLYSSVLRFTGSGTYVRIFEVSAIYGFGHFVIFTLFGFTDIPRSIGIIQPALFAVGVASWRFLANLIVSRDSRRMRGQGTPGRRVMIYGAGNAGRQLSAALAVNPDFRIVGFIDDDPQLIGTMLNGLRVTGPKRLTERLEALKIEDVLIAMPSAPMSRRREIIESLQSAHVTVRLLPGVDQLASGKVAISDLRQPEIEDILGRDPVPPDHQLMSKTIASKVVMITGAGGSIGSELCRQAMQLGPKTLLLLEISEFNLYAIHRELEAINQQLAVPVKHIIPILLDAKNRQSVCLVMEKFKPDTVFHAAAYKHVPLAEANPCSTVANNVVSTRVMAQTSIEHSVRNFVLISTDKAVRPTNVMGASKRLAEQILQDLAQTSTDTIFTMVRFGNVLESSGSVVPLFRSQIKAGGPLTITHPDIIRYFMTIPEAAQLVIQASALAVGGDVFVLDMGTPVNIVSLAERMIELSGLSVRNDSNPNGDIAIEFIGLRPGEKLYEELLIDGNVTLTLHPRIMKTHETFLKRTDLAKVLTDMDSAISASNDAEIVKVLKRGVREFKHNV